MEIDHIKEVVHVMRHREKSTYYNKSKQAVCRNVIEDGDNGNTSSYHYLDVPGGQFFRQVIIQWMYNMANTFRFSHQVVIVANYYLDTMVQYKTKEGEQRLIVNSVDYQLASLTSIYVAMKIYGSRVFPITELIKLGRDQFSIEDVSNMERILVNDVLQWKLTPPTVLCYISEFDKLYKLSVQEQSEANDDDDSDVCCSLIEECSTATKESEEDEEENATTSSAIKLVQNVIYDDEYCMYPPSIIACAAMILAIKQQEPQQHQQRRVNESFLSDLKQVMNLSSSEDVKVLENALKLLDPSTTSSSTTSTTSGRYLSDNMDITSTTSRSSTVATNTSNSSTNKMLKKQDGEHCRRRRNQEVVIVNQVEAMKCTKTATKDDQERLYLKRGFDSTGTLNEQGVDEEDEPQETMISPTSVNGQR